MERIKKKPEYDPEKVMEQFTNCIVDAYRTGTDNNSLRKISEQFGITLMKTRQESTIPRSVIRSIRCGKTTGAFRIS